MESDPLVSFDSLLSPRGLLVIGGMMVGLFLYGNVEIYLDPRPRGSVDEIERLSERGDLNLLFVVIDTLRADRLSCYGYERETSPGLDYLARDGARFSRHRAQSSWTKNSMASLWTGLYPVRTGVTRHSDAVPSEARMPAEIFHDAGYATAGIWRNGWVAPNFGFSQGFDVYQSPLTRSGPKNIRRKPRAGRIDGTDIDVIFSANEFIRVNADRKWMLYLHLMDVHQYVASEETAIFGNRYTDAYDNSILWVDQQIRALTGELDRLGIREQTLIVIVSDHGEAFGEHGREGHARDVYGEVTLTPWIISFPFRLADGLVVEKTTQNIDVWPTVLDLLGLPTIEGADGVSHLDRLTGASSPVIESVDVAHLDRTWGRVHEDPEPTVGISFGKFRLVRYFVDGNWDDELFDLEADPYEQENVAGEHPAVLADLQERADEYLSRDVTWENGVSRVELDEMDLMQLRALGYSIETNP